MQLITEIILPTRPQPDTIVAIFLLQQFASTHYPGIETATVSTDPAATPGSPHQLLIDVGGGEFDHHGTTKCATELVAEKLGINKNPELRQMIAYARRDDTKGQGIISKDPIDRSFGLSGLIASLNKQFSEDANKVVQIVLPLLHAQYLNAYEHYVGLPNLVTTLSNNGDFKSVSNKKSAVKLAFVESDNVGLPGYLRSNNGGNYNVVVQRRSTGHTNIITKQDPKLDLSTLAALLRLHEANLRSSNISDESTLYNTGTHAEVSNWYYDIATNSILNGGVTPDKIEATAIPWDDLQLIVVSALAAD